MWQLFHMIPLFLCDILPVESRQYNCFLLLQEIAAIAFSPVLSREQIGYLEVLIQQYLETFKDILLPYKPLPPKCHYLIHLPRMIRRFDY